MVGPACGTRPAPRLDLPVEAPPRPGGRRSPWRPKAQSFPRGDRSGDRPPQPEQSGPGLPSPCSQRRSEGRGGTPASQLSERVCGMRVRVGGQVSQTSPDSPGRFIWRLGGGGRTVKLRPGLTLRGTMRHLVGVSVVVLPAAALAAGCTSAPGHPAAQAPSSSSAPSPPPAAPPGQCPPLRFRRPALTLGQRPPCAPITEPSITTTTLAPGILAAGSPVPATLRLLRVPGHHARQSLHSVGNRERGDGPPCGACQTR